MKTTLHLVLILVIFCHFTILNSQTTTDFTPTKDNSIYSENNNSNGEGELFAGKTGSRNGNNNRRALVEFDISSIPSGATITNVSLRLNVNKVAPGAGTQNYEIFQVLKEWGEGTSSGGGTGGTAVAPDATWSDAMLGTSFWNTSGGDFSASALSNLNISGNGNYTFLTSTLFVNTVQGWLDNSSTNHGVILIGDESVSNTARQFGSKDIGIAPILSVTWNAPLSTEEFFLNNFRIISNLKNETIQVKVPKNFTNVEVSMYNMLGKLALKSYYHSNQKIDISELSSGIYLVKVEGSGQISSKLFAKK